MQKGKKEGNQERGVFTRRMPHHLDQGVCFQVLTQETEVVTLSNTVRQS